MRSELFLKESLFRHDYNALNKQEFAPTDLDVGFLPFPLIDKKLLSGYLLEWWNDPDIRKHLSPSTPTDLEGIGKFVDMCVNDKDRAYFMVYDARVQVPRSDRIHPLGFAGMKAIDWERRSFERSIIIGRKDLWNKGFGRKIGEGIFLLAESIGLEIVTANAHRHNIASIKNLTRQFGKPVRMDDEYAYFERRLPFIPDDSYCDNNEDWMDVPETLFERYKGTMNLVA